MSFDLLRLIQNGPTILKVAGGAQHAYREYQRGNPAALIPFLTQDVIDATAVYDRRAPEAVRGLLAGVGQAMNGFREDLGLLPPGEVAPWFDFGKHLYARNWHVITVLGGKGWGKTALALKLAWKFQQIYGYPVEVTGFWGDDVPFWASKISMKRLVARMQKVTRYLDQEDEDTNIDDGLTEADLSRKGKKGAVVETPTLIPEREINRLKRRIVVVDEAQTFFGSMSAAGQNASREASRNINNQVRHLESIYIFSTQRMSEMPDYLQDTATMFYRYAGEEVIKRDHKQGTWRANRERWQEILAGLDAIRSGAYLDPLPTFMTERTREAVHRAAAAHAVYWQPPYDTLKAWSWVRAPSDVGGHGYEGVAPNDTWMAAAKDAGVPTRATRNGYQDPPDIEILDRDGSPIDEQDDDTVEENDDDE